MEADNAMSEAGNQGYTQVCPDCSSQIKVNLTPSQYKEYEEDARIRYLKAQKVCVYLYDHEVPISAYDHEETVHNALRHRMLVWA